MPTKTLSIISSVITVILLLIIGAVVFFIDLIALNGVSGREGGIALTALGVCESITVILCAILAGRLTTLFVTKYNWNNILAVIVSIVAVLILGVVLYVVALMLSVGVAEFLFYN